MKNLIGIHDKLANSHPDLIAGGVRCEKCGRTMKVDSAECLRSGWPKCCGYTMTLLPARAAIRAAKEEPMIRYDDNHEVDEITGTDAQFEMLSDSNASLHIGGSHVFVNAVGGKLRIVVAEEGKSATRGMPGDGGTG